MAALTTFRNEGLTFDVSDVGPADGEVVVLLHGYPGNKGTWDEVAPPLADAGFRVLAPDQRGYSPGARPKGRRSYTVDHLTSDVLALVAAAGAERFHVVGHDWGGALAWALGAQHADQVASLTSLATPHPSALARSLFTSTQLLRSWYVLFYQLPLLPELSETSGPGRRAFERTLVRSGLAPERARRYVEMLQDGAAGPAVNWYRAVPFSARVTSFAPIAVPTLYVYAGADFALGPEAAELTGRYVTGDYTYVVIAGASHWLPEESGEEVIPVLLAFLRSHPMRSGRASPARSTHR